MRKERNEQKPEADVAAVVEAETTDQWIDCRGEHGAQKVS